ncbi:hypothetical protein LTR10_002423 [Elasticomyces elasticus]|nr:hypothetical protein LTR10_002423 [Elasticomyces elasticus]KAK4973510.1 hypothetical protein LTR42_005499 [Elasticomyces elasticus]
MASTSYLVDRLSAEIRRHIYGFVLGCSDFAKRPGPDDYPNKSISITLAATCRKIHDEVLELFYDTRTIRLTVIELDDVLTADSFTSYARCVQLIDCVRTPSPAKLRNVLYKTLLLPKIKAVTIAADCLAYGEGLVKKEITDEDWWTRRDDEPEMPDYQDVTLGSQMIGRRFARQAGLGEVTCVDMGRYKLTGAFEKVQVLHTKLLRMWPAVAATPKDYDAFAIAKALIEEWDIHDTRTPSAVLTWVAHTSLKLFVGLLQASKTGNYTKEDVAHGDPRYKYRWYCPVVFMQSIKSIPGYMESRLPKDFMHVPIHTLGAHHDSALLEFWTEQLSLNIATCREPVETAEEPLYLDARPHWCELEGGEPIGIIKGRQDKLRSAEISASLAKSTEWINEMLGNVTGPIQPVEPSRLDGSAVPEDT